MHLTVPDIRQFWALLREKSDWIINYFFSFLKNNNKESNEIIPDFQNQRKSFNTAYMYIAQCGLDQGATKITDEWNYEDLYFVLKAP